MVLVDDSSENTPPPYRCVDRDDDAWVVVGRVLIEALMWTVPTEVALVLTEYGTGVFLVIDQNPVGAFDPDAANEAFRERVRSRRPWRNLDHVDALGHEHRVKGPLNLASRSRIKNRNAAARPPRSITTLRACWVTHAAVGWAVTPRMCTRRVAISMTNST